MEAKLNKTWGELKPLVKQLAVSDRWLLLKWLVELLQQEPQIHQRENTRIDFNAVHQICDEIRSLPVLDNRSPDEIIGDKGNDFIQTDIDKINYELSQ